MFYIEKYKELLRKSIENIRNGKFTKKELKYPRLLAEEAIGSINMAYNLELPIPCQKLNFENFLTIRKFLKEREHEKLVEKLDNEHLACIDFVIKKLDLIWNEIYAR